MAIAAVVAGLGVGGYFWWQSQQGTASKDLRNVTAELAAAYSAMNEEDLTTAARAFRKVLEQDRNNAAAQQGMEQLEPLYTSKIEQAIADKDARGLNALVLDYSAYFPGSLKLDGFAADLELLQEEMRRKAIQ